MALEAPPPPPIQSKTKFQLNRRFAASAAGFLRPDSQQRAARFPSSPFSVQKTSYRTPSPILSAAVKEQKAGAVTESESKPVRIVALVGQGTLSPLKATPWEEVMLHTVSKTQIFSGFTLLLFFSLFSFLFLV